MTEIKKPKVLSKKVREAMSLEELYQTGLSTPSIEKLILAKEDFSKPCPNYCDTFCKIPCKNRDLGSVDFRQQKATVDVLIVLPSLSPDMRTKYGKTKFGWSDDDLHQKIVAYLVDRHLQGAKVGLKYILKCRPSEKPKVSISALRKCSPYLMQQIRTLKPKLIISLGSDTSKGLGVKNPRRGFFDTIEIDGVEIKVMSTIHPRITAMIRQNASGSFWGTDFLSILDRDFKKVGQVLRGEVVCRDIEDVVAEFVRERLFVTTTVDQVRMLRDEIFSLPKKSILAWDCETTSLDPWSEDSRTLSYQFTYKRPADDKVISVVVPLWHRENRCYDPADVFPFLEEILLSTETEKIGHNIAFDILFAKVVHNLHPKQVAFDTMLLLHSINSGLQGMYDLKTSTNDMLFELQMGGYDDKIDIAALKKAAAAQMKLALSKGTADEEDEQEDALPWQSEPIEGMSFNVF